MKVGKQRDSFVRPVWKWRSLVVVGWWWRLLGGRKIEKTLGMDVGNIGEKNTGM